GLACNASLTDLYQGLIERHFARIATLDGAELPDLEPARELEAELFVQRPRRLVLNEHFEEDLPQATRLGLDDRAAHHRLAEPAAARRRYDAHTTDPAALAAHGQERERLVARETRRVEIDVPQLDDQRERRSVEADRDEVVGVRLVEQPREPLEIERARGAQVGGHAFAATFVFARAFCAMNFSAASYASSSTICFGGDFIRYALGPSSAPEMPLFSASFAIRTASITIPAEFGESQTSSFSSMLSGTLPNDEPSIRMYAHFRSVSHGT